MTVALVRAPVDLAASSDMTVDSRRTLARRVAVAPLALAVAPALKVAAAQEALPITLGEFVGSMTHGGGKDGGEGL